MRVHRNKTTYAEDAQRSVKRDFKQYRARHMRPEVNEEPCANAQRRIVFVGENSSYYKYRSYIVGKLIRLVEQGSFGGWRCEFVHDDDRRALNSAAGWSDTKSQYIFDCVKFK